MFPRAAIFRCSHRGKIRKKLFLFASWKDFSTFRTGPPISSARNLHLEQIISLLEQLEFFQPSN